jgi:hypothetical protein
MTKLCILILLVACVGCANTRVVYRVNFVYHGESIGIKLGENEVEITGGLTR